MFYDPTRWLPVELNLSGSYAYEGMSIGGQSTSHTMSGFGVTFDLGHCSPKAVQSNFVFITHAHHDHVRGMMDHFFHRKNMNMEPARYFVMASRVGEFQNWIAATALMSQSRHLPNMEITPIVAGQVVPLVGHRDMSVVAFRSYHTIPCMGYSLVRTSDRLLPEFVGAPSEKLIAAKKAGIEIKGRYTSNDVVFPGDTNAKILWDMGVGGQIVRSARTLLLECTFCEDEPSPEDTFKSGHMHIQDVLRASAEGIFDNVENLVLTHFSSRYSTERIKRITSELFAGTNLENKVKLLLN